VGGRAAGRKASTRGVFHAWHSGDPKHDRMDWSKERIVTPETLTYEETTVEEVDDAEELLVEEVSIDGLCGVY
jgi:mycofactocin precursor